MGKKRQKFIPILFKGYPLDENGNVLNDYWDASKATCREFSPTEAQDIMHDLGLMNNLHIFIETPSAGTNIFEASFMKRESAYTLVFLEDGEMKGVTANKDEAVTVEVCGVEYLVSMVLAPNDKKAKRLHKRLSKCDTFPIEVHYYPPLVKF